MKKRILNIIFYILLIVITVLIIVNNKDNSIIFKRNIIKDDISYNKYKDYNYVTLDLRDSLESRYSISDKDKLKETIYVVSYDDIDILVYLTPKTVLTSKVNVMKIKDDMNSVNLKEELDDYTFVSNYYTNSNLLINEEIIKIKYYFALIFILILILLIIINLIKMLFVKKTKYVKIK